jgi:uncharacterized peroxidase-related enzyme
VEAHGEDLRKETGNPDLAAQVKRDYRQAPLAERERALCEFAEKLTRTPSAMQPTDLDRLRRLELSDRDILDAVQVIAYFNYINRIAEALGVDPEPEMHAAWLAHQRDTSRMPPEGSP